MIETLREGEVLLDDQQLPISGPVTMVKATQTPGKITIGKTTRADSVLADEWVQEDWREGGLVSQMDEQTQAGRFFWATANTRRRRYMHLPEEVFSLPNPTSTGPADPGSKPGYSWEYGNEVYVSFAGKVRKWNGPTAAPGSEWGPQLVDLGQDPTHVLVFQGAVLVALGSSYQRLSGGVWTNYPAVKASYFATYQVGSTAKVFKVDPDGQVEGSNDGVTWVNTVGGKVDDRTIRGLMAHRNQDDLPTLYVRTDKGLVSVDASAKEVQQTSLALLPGAATGLGGCTWSDGNLYFSDGLAVFRYPRGGQIVNVGLDKDDGLPAFVRGRITQLVPHPSLIVAVVDATNFTQAQSDSAVFGTAPLWDAQTIPTGFFQGYSALMAHNGTGWHTLFLSEASSQGIRGACLTTAYDQVRRLVFGDGPVVKYIVLPEGNYDPLLDSSATFAPQAEFISSWYDSGQSEVPKIDSSLKLRALPTSITATEQIDVYYGLDDSEAWTYLGSITPSTMLANGVCILRFNGGRGVSGYSYRHKFVFRRGSDARKTPVLVFSDLKHKRVPEVAWGWTFTVVSQDLDYLLSTRDLIQAKAEAREFIPFAYRTEADADEAYVQVTSVSAIEAAGPGTGRYTVTVVEIDPTVTGV